MAYSTKGWMLIEVYSIMIKYLKKHRYFLFIYEILDIFAVE